MLATLTRKICPWLSLAVVTTIGCGKKINDAKIQPARSIENQVIPSTYVLSLDGAFASRQNYILPQDTQFKVPDRLIVRLGDTNGKIVEIAHEVSEYISDDYFFKCIYVASSNPAEMVLDKCVDYDDDDFGDVTYNTFTLYKNDRIQIRFTGAPSSDLKVDAFYSMKWIYDQK